MLRAESVLTLTDKYNELCIHEPPDDSKGAAIHYDLLREVCHVLEKFYDMSDSGSTFKSSIFSEIGKPDELLRRAAQEISKYDPRLP
ncbi:MAG: hypothetical protein IPM60_01990 [Rhodospirillales bacterium]|nr:hypothetical protein [Rhodospirillales bacterium]